MSKKYDSTVARMAGNIAAGMVSGTRERDIIIRWSVALARDIIEEVKRTEPADEPASVTHLGPTRYERTPTL